MLHAGFQGLAFKGCAALAPALATTTVAVNTVVVGSVTRFILSPFRSVSCRDTKVAE